MGKVFFALSIFLTSCVLFKWPGYLVRDDADARLRGIVQAPEQFLRKIANFGGKTGEDPAADGENTRPSAGDPFAGSASSGATSTPGSVYPLSMTILNTTGTALDVTVLGKGPDFLRFQRNSDQRLFDLKLSSLAEASRDAVMPLPTSLGAQDFQRTMPKKKAQSAPPPPRTSMADGVRKEIERNERKIREQKGMKESGSLTSSQKSMAVKTIQRLQGENARLKLKLSSYEDSF